MFVTLTLVNSVLEYNSAETGGAIYINDIGTLIALNCIFVNNWAV